MPIALKATDSIKGNCFEDYFYLAGISSYFGARRFEVVQTQNNTITLQEMPKHAATCSQVTEVFLTIVKILSFATFIFPMLMYMGRRYSRRGKTFVLQSPISNPLAAPAPNSVNAIVNNKPSVLRPSVPNPLLGRVTVGTYNVLFPQSLPTSQFSTKIGYSADPLGRIYANTDFRIKVISKNILNSNLDILCVQEMTQDMLNKLMATSLGQKYHCVWQSHTLNSHGVGVLYKKTQFRTLNQSTPQITLHVPNALNPTRMIPKKRTHVMVDLQDATTQKIYRVASCHLIDPRDFTTAQKGAHAQQIIQSTQAASAYPIDKTIIAGDMNQDQFGDIGTPTPSTSSPNHATAFQPFLQNGFSADTNLDSSEYDKADFRNSPIFSKNRRIDWLFATGTQPAHLPLAQFDNRGSDHRLVAVVV